MIFLIEICQQMISWRVLLILEDMAKSKMLMLLYISLICRTQHHLQNKVNAVKAMLMHRCKIYGLGYIDNSNIKVECLA